MFELHSRLAEDGFTLGDMPLCRVLLINDSRYPWFVLVPRRKGIAEIFQLSDQDQHQLIFESSRLSMAMTQGLAPDKLNIAAIGNLVPQLHLHHVARYTGDAAWPAPIWGRLPAIPYDHREREALLARIELFRLDGFLAAC